ncbi:MAG: hypothetical protein JNM41_16360 [Flavipsychrobacter sp.]|nr:hypothetical protein [Flavipsychrobacter sp.]
MFTQTASKIKCFSGSLAAVIIMSVSTSALAQDFKREGNVVTYNGNKIILSASERDTIVVVDPITNEEIMQVRVKGPRPLLINGKKIYEFEYVTSMPSRKDNKFSLEEQLITNLAKFFNSFPDATYRVYASSFVIDDQGKVVYFEYSHLSARDDKGKDLPLSDLQKQATGKEIAGNCRLVNMNPAKLNGKPVAVLSDLYLHDYKFTVRNHVTEYVKANN